MTSLTIHNAAAPFSHEGAITDFPRIAAAMARANITLERWEADVALSADADDAAILAAYAPQVARLKARAGYRSEDVVRMTPDHPMRAELRQKFLSEHVHDDDEVRFFVEGSGLFCIHHKGAVYALTCTAGDLIVLPAGTRHWFDTGEQPRFTAIRLFISPEGWVARYTGETIAEAMMAAQAG
ncbi:1,2-dihydroxy-3-keto-5-methylthiopentene dioxygenase [Novosphingobium terrae]|uniref:1,2-dihydroxy-3-keto-5-methylthiopentene dioxygenase n=1 Tax=Novosphingobium terrae TaxID=2726189 RepID=UPI00197FD583|nr:cupin domain-containing protein [Novosphingobium terrae]